MRSINLDEGIKTGSVGALVPALGLGLCVSSGLIIGSAGALALSGSYFIYRFIHSDATGDATPAPAIAFSGFIAGFLWKFGFITGEKIILLAYLTAFVLCTGGIACRIPDAEKGYNFAGILGAAAGFFIICLLLGTLREITHLSAGQSLFASGAVFLLMKVFFKSPSGRRI